MPWGRKTMRVLFGNVLIDANMALVDVRDHACRVRVLPENSSEPARYRLVIVEENHTFELAVTLATSMWRVDNLLLRVVDGNAGCFTDQSGVRWQLEEELPAGFAHSKDWRGVLLGNKDGVLGFESIFCSHFYRFKPMKT
jgi:hypothetical protein